VTIPDIRTNVVDAIGFAPIEHVSWPNRDPYGDCFVYAEKIRKASCEERLYVETDIQDIGTYDPALFPFTPDELATAFSSTAVHEIGHTLGLVSLIIFGDGAYHNQTQDNNGWIMNRSKPAMQRFEKPGAIQQSWKPRNRSYLEFILPTSSQGNLP
jgi:hypothetical protein